MKKIKSTLPNILLSLTAICFIAGAALSTANKYTAHIIAAAKVAALQQAIQNVTPPFDNNPVEDYFKVAVSESDTLTVYPAKMSGIWVGSAVEGYTKSGFSGLIRVLVGFDVEGKLCNYAVLEHNETPGLGSKMEEWFRMNKNKQNIIGRDMTQGSLITVKDGGDIDAITAATITTRAFLEAINLAYNAYLGFTDAVSGATVKETNQSATGNEASDKTTDNSSDSDTQHKTVSLR